MGFAPSSGLRGVDRDAIPTPALVLDLEAFEFNVATMLARARAMGVGIRPHAKSHKCVDIARRLLAAGALGACCATIGEAEALAAGGIGGLLLTSPMVTPDQVSRCARLLMRGADITLVVDSPANLPELARIARQVARRLPVIVELDVGVGRTGCASVEDAVAHCRAVAAEQDLEWRGVQAYWGNLQQVMPFADRRSRVAVQADRLRALLAALRAAGLHPAIVTGSGTGTHAIDGALGLFTELQAGSFLFLDSCYGSVPLDDSGNPFRPSLFVCASVVSANAPGRAIVDAGWKAFATDSGLPAPRRGAPQGASYRYMGDEHGAIDHAEDAPLQPGDHVELLVSHCDPTVNLHARYVVVKGDEVVDTWPISARGYEVPA